MFHYIRPSREIGAMLSCSFEYFVSGHACLNRDFVHR
jgi:hypothetical protein